MSQSTPGPASQAFTRFLIGFAVVQGALLSAIVLAMVFEVITVDQMVPLIIAVALIGGSVLGWRMMKLNKQRQREAMGFSGSAQSGQERGGGDRTGLSGLGQKDPMAKYRDPNR